MRAPQRGGDWGHWHLSSQGPCWSAPQLCKWRSPSCDPSCGWGYLILAACVSTYAALLNPALKSAPICPDGVRVRPVLGRCTIPGGVPCTPSRPFLRSPPAAERSSNLAPAAEAPYSVIGDCARATVIDPGTVSNVAGMLIQRGTVFDCPLTGDIEGVARVVLNLTLRNVGTPQVEGRVFGESIFLVTKFFGRTDLNGTFEGPFNGSLEEVRFGAAKTNRHGTGDFAGLVLHGVAVQNPPGSGTEVENGRVVGGDEP